MVNKIWGFFIIVGIGYSAVSGKISLINQEILNSTVTSLELIMKIFPVLALWLGIMKIAENSGLLSKFSSLISPILGRIFPEIPKGHESLSLIASNVVINMFGLGSAATPFGLKAMESLQKLNPNKDTASRSMITFLIINTGGVTLIPTTVISMRMHYGSVDPTGILTACIVSTAVALAFGIFVDFLINKRR